MTFSTLSIILTALAVWIPKNIQRISVCFVSRLFSPGSKIKTIDYLERYQGITYPKDKIYRFLDTLCKQENQSEKKRTKEQEITSPFDFNDAVARWVNRK